MLTRRKNETAVPITARRRRCGSRDRHQCHHVFDFRDVEDRLAMRLLATPSNAHKDKSIIR
jgi:hypothetical protein